MLKQIKAFMVLALAVAGFMPASAQWRVGLQGGYSYNSLTTEAGYYYDRHYNPRGGFAIGVPVQYGFNGWLAVQAEVDYVQKNYELERTGFFHQLGERLTNHYLSVPVFARFSFGGERLRGYLDAGFYAGGWLAARREGTTFSMFSSTYDPNPDAYGDLTELYDYDEKYEFDSRLDNRFEGGTLIGVGVEYAVTSTWAVQAGCKYYHSLTDTQKDYMLGQVPRYNNTFVFQVGVMATIGR